MTKPKAVLSARGLAKLDTTPKPKPKVRAASTGRSVAAARSRGTNISNMTAAEVAEVIDPDKPLTEKAKLFVDFWAKGDSILSAARRAGYADSGAMAYQLVKMPNVLKLKAEISAKYEEAAQITRKSVMDMHLEAFEMAKMMAEPSTMVAAAREMGKMAGYYAPVEHRVKVDVTGNVIIDKMNSLSDAELLKIIQGGAQAVLPGT